MLLSVRENIKLAEVFNKHILCMQTLRVWLWFAAAVFWVLRPETGFDGYFSAITEK